MRITERFNKKTGIWEEIDFKKLKRGDIFRFFDDGERYVNKKDGNNVWIAISKPYVHPAPNPEKILTIDTLY